MMRSLTAALIALLALSACGTVRESRINPFNWFGKSEPTEQVAPLATKAPDARPLVHTLSELTVERYSTGAIIRATGVNDAQGWWDADLVEVATDDPTQLVYDFRIKPPGRETPVGTPRSREVTAAASVSANKLAKVSRITVQGLTNARSTGR